ncbi:MAG TPA: nuclear transport factor 2 family protein [Desulfomonilaceae bacterium]|nr:nuclear transport factor 2 family protein [Desulfomonilaceae bacterium]
MKTKGFVGLLVILLVAFATQGAIAADPAVEREVKAVLDAYASAFGKKDVSAIMALIAPDQNVVFIDSEVELPFSGMEKIKESYTRDFSRMESGSLTYSNTSVGSKGDVAWFATGITATVVVDKESMSVPAQWSGVLEKRGGKWLIVQSHFSFPAPDEQEDKQK